MNLSGKTIILVSLEDLKNMCYSPISIINPSKYVSLRYRDRFFIQVPCGKCAQCQQQKSNEWYFRSYHHALDTISHGGFVVFDTLTYANQHLPYISDFVNVRGNDYPCFNSNHLRLFVARLRQQCKRRYNSNFTYFISSEYGTDQRKHHRPHYHALFYVLGPIQPIEFSQLVAKCWIYGRTDGYPWKSAAYVLSNIFRKFDDHTLKCCKYVSKYVQKSCSFQKEIDRRIDVVMRDIANDYELFDDDDNDWLSTVDAARLRQKFKRCCNQFHRQSSGFGSSYLACVDLDQLFRDGTFFMPDNKSVSLPIGLPTYYKRKLFYQLVEVEGSKCWIPNEIGNQYLAHREKVNLKSLSNKMDCMIKQFNLQSKVFDSSDMLADYCLNVRGRIKADNPPSQLEDRINHVSFYNYITQSDRLQFGTVGLVADYKGNVNAGYTSNYLGRHYKPSFFYHRFCFHDEEKEKQLSIINDYIYKLDSGKQKAYEQKQRLTNLFHWLLV